jgi:hypothetical protein
MNNLTTYADLAAALSADASLAAERDAFLQRAPRIDER